MRRQERTYRINESLYLFFKCPKQRSHRWAAWCPAGASSHCGRHECQSAWLRIWATLCRSPTGKALPLMTTFSCFLKRCYVCVLCWALCIMGLVLAGELFTIRSSHLMFTTVWPILTDQNQINVKYMWQLECEKENSTLWEIVQLSSEFPNPRTKI